MSLSMYQKWIKPAFDFLAASIILILASPLLLPIILLLAIANRGSVFFIQPRPGLDGKIFHLIKLKTMNDRRGSNGDLLPDRKRLTKIGKWVRGASLDELPQLINVIKGDMSLVGPRPLLVKYLPLYNDHQMRRHEVKPGITGWAQINGRNSIPWGKKFELDVYYVDNINFALDVKILITTIQKVLRRKDVNTSAVQTMEPFTGNNKNR